jgi:hypothetical protein
MEQIKSDGEVIAEIYRNAALGLTSISDILPEIEDGGIREEIVREHEGYEEICSEAASLALKYNIDVKEPSPVKKAMMWSAIKMNAGGDNSESNIAQMMIRGTVTGITSLKTTLSESEEKLCDDVKKLLQKFITLEESYEKRLKKFL